MEKISSVFFSERRIRTLPSTHKKSECGGKKLIQPQQQAGRLSIEKKRREKRLVEAMAMRRKEQEEIYYILYQKHIFSR